MNFGAIEIITSNGKSKSTVRLSPKVKITLNKFEGNGEYYVHLASRGKCISLGLDEMEEVWNVLPKMKEMVEDAGNHNTTLDGNMLSSPPITPSAAIQPAATISTPSTTALSSTLTPALSSTMPSPLSSALSSVQPSALPSTLPPRHQQQIIFWDQADFL